MILFLKKAGFSCLFLLLFFVKSYSVQLAASCYFTPQQNIAYSHLLNLEFKSSLQSLKGENDYDFQLKSLNYCVDAFINCDKTKYQIGRRLALKWIDSVSSSNESPEKKFVEAILKIHWSFMASFYGEKVFATLEMREAYLLLKENYLKYPKHKPTLLYYGLLNSYISEIPENYKWIVNAMGFKQSGLPGQTMINASKSCDPYLDLEMNALLLMRKPKYRIKDGNILKTSNYLMQKHGNELLVQFMVGLYYLKNKNTAEAIPIVTSYRRVVNPMFVYQKALMHYNILEIDTAIFYFKKFLKLNKADYYKKDVSLKLAYLYSLEGDSVAAKRYQTTVKKIGNDALYADKSAEKNSSFKLPAFHILKSRICFDAGYWHDSQRFLLLWRPASKVDKSEYFYRLGKIHMELKDFEKSKSFFKQCLNICPKDKVYFGPFACLNLAEIYLWEHNSLLAKNYLSTCKNYNDFEYQQTYRIWFNDLSKLIK